MSSHYWTRTAVLILVAGVVFAAGDHVVNRHLRQDQGQGQDQSQVQAKSTTAGSPTPSSTTLAPDTSKNCTSTNDTDCKGGVGASGISRFAHDNAGMLTRTFYVLLAVTSIIVVYFIIRAVRIRNRKSRTKRYGVISTNDDRMEMTPLDEDDDDEDLTVFEANGRLIK